MYDYIYAVRSLKPDSILLAICVVLHLKGKIIGKLKQSMTCQQESNFYITVQPPYKVHICYLIYSRPFILKDYV